jgi:hypothetical protein
MNASFNPCFSGSTYLTAFAAIFKKYPPVTSQLESRFSSRKFVNLAESVLLFEWFFIIFLRPTH